MAKIHKYEKRIGVFGGLDQTPYCTIQGGGPRGGGDCCWAQGRFFFAAVQPHDCFPHAMGRFAPHAGAGQLLFDVEK